MGKLTKILVIAVILIAIVSYGTFYYIYKNLVWKLDGFGFTEENFVNNQTGLLGELVTIAEKLKVSISIKNNSSLSFKLTNFKLKVKNAEGRDIGTIKVIRSVSVPSNGQTIVDIEILNINESALLSDFLGGKLKSYKFVVSGMLGGLLPFRYSAKILS